MNYQKLILAGNATKDAQRRKSKKSKVSYTTFSLAVNEHKDRPTYFPIAVFGKLAEPVATYVTKGRQILVDGRIEVSGDGRFNVVADRVLFGAGTEKQKPTKKSEKKK
jgi:single-strand DNA-binding protein